ncbi:MAG: helix-turn-helix domain-containing protein [Christensenellaceae bacterium]|nr:helix-turn-helix domain-containing protein [Christensenellaceae bacterium]
MAVFRVERTRDYTVMSNNHLKDSTLTLKAKGLLSMMLSLPDEWNYTTRGLAAICKEGVDAIGKTLKELEQAGYIIRRQLRGRDGRICDTEYTIFEKPRKPKSSVPDTTSPDTENPDVVNSDMEKPDTDNPAQLNTKKSNTQKTITDLSKTHSFFPSAADELTDGFDKRAEIKEQIEYDVICQQYDGARLDELVEIMLEVAMNQSPTIKIGRDAEYPTGFVQQRFEKINSTHIEKVMDGIRENTTRVWNTKAYLMAALFNSVSTIDNHYTTLVNHDFHGSL